MPDSLDRMRRAIERKGPASNRDRPEIVDPVHMVGVIVRVQHRIHRLYFGRQQLQPQLRGRVDEDAFVIRRLDDSGDSGTSVPRIFGGADCARTSNDRDAEGRARAEHNQPHP
jgi:hypothetical protein